ncbi:Asp23/Gls24 family envelope stress response protein [Natranaerofaba carboxydovora]|uniref:Asp23/Gls24 family envelope stress response protein n=1 Tax=Natranaerofaba carboxydovora TaxID=2742683 RepID=UPI001F1367C9|nr:Asp23/Gls24 family envelope stress response protein [Natranaerofaba carboxydovora]UMZ74131.1 Asp23 family, cell envelope-related function [Natranaerofaba carboxydovora]
MTVQKYKGDSVYIVDDVLKTIAGIAVSKVDGVQEMMGTSVVGNLAEKVRKKDISRGINIQRTEDDKINVAVSVTIRYGIKIPEISQDIQNAIRETIHTMTGYEVESIKVNIQGVKFDSELNQEENE